MSLYDYFACLLPYFAVFIVLFFFSSRRRHTRSLCDWSSDVCSSDLRRPELEVRRVDRRADLGERLALGLHAYHVTRDVHAERSGGGVTRERDPSRLLRLDVAGAVRGVAQALEIGRAHV